ncbi:MAG TPA: choice-of-anchor X domain-containing protein [Thermoanaerobaculia bacterium]|nr:choice-of-anchor X domain-containing protein [Thermoanaerobaculia bacterium]
MAWKRWSRSPKVLFLTAVLAVIALTAWAGARQGPIVEEATAPPVASAQAVSLSAPLPPPTQVFIQKTGAFPDIGNVLVTVTLSSTQLSRKVSDGTRDFVTIGFQEQQVILRDDGQQGDATAGDGVFTGIGQVDDADLQARNSADQTELTNRGTKAAPLFAGRAIVGSETPQAFDYTGFSAGRAVAFNQAVAFLEPESATVTASGPANPVTGSLNLKAVVLGTNTFQERSLMIRDLAVVTDPARTWNPCTGAGTPNGVWTFNHLMTEMANQPASGIDPAVFVETWLSHWQANQTINTHVVNSRPNVNTIILNPWPKRPDGHIDLAQSPFRLLAIVARPDLRRTTAGGGSYSINVSGNFLDAGEARFVFGLLDKRAGCSVTPFAVIFEYRVPRCECQLVKSWAQGWVDLFSFVPGTAAYNDRLQVITESFAKANSNPARPNGSALGQLRTNEITLVLPNPPWELREFQLNQFPFSFLREVTTADTAIDSFNNSVTFDNWILTAVAPALTPPNFQDPIPPVPLFFSGVNFLGSNPATTGTNFFWRVTNAQVPNLSPAGGNNTTNWGRHRASLAACNGCHGRESRPAGTIAPFVHVDPSTALGNPARLSEFLTGVNNLADPQEPAGLPQRSFDDLARREMDIKRLARMTCFGFHPINVSAVQSSLRSTGRLPADLFQMTTGAPMPHQVPVGVDDFRRNVVLEVH